MKGQAERDGLAATREMTGREMELRRLQDERTGRELEVLETRIRGQAETGGDCGDQDEKTDKKRDVCIAKTTLKGQAVSWRFRSLG